MPLRLHSHTHQLQLREITQKPPNPNPNPMSAFLRALTPGLAKNQTDIHSWQVRQRPLVDQVTIASLGHHQMSRRGGGRGGGEEGERKGGGKGRIGKVI